LSAVDPLRADTYDFEGGLVGEANVVRPRSIEADAERDPKGSRTPSPIDVHVGNRIRLRRMLLGMSQEALGEKLGLTFQQVQKYEKGINRISASRLFKIANVLGASVQFFFKEMSPSIDSDEPAHEEDAGESAILEFLRTRDGVELNTAFLRIPGIKSRRAILELVRSLGGSNMDDAGSSLPTSVGDKPR
jgi:transcriptional regulator with XRE-family HTH domain